MKPKKQEKKTGHRKAKNEKMFTTVRILKKTHQVIKELNAQHNRKEYDKGNFEQVEIYKTVDEIITKAQL